MVYLVIVDVVDDGGRHPTLRIGQRPHFEPLAFNGVLFHRTPMRPSSLSAWGVVIPHGRFGNNTDWTCEKAWSSGTTCPGNPWAA